MPPSRSALTTDSTRGETAPPGSPKMNRSAATTRTSAGRRRCDAHRSMHDGAQCAFPRKRSLLRPIGIDRLEASIRQRTAEIMKEPPGNAVGAADHDRRGADERAQLRCEFRQALRLDAEKHIVVHAQLGSRACSGPTYASLIALGDVQPGGAQLFKGPAPRQHGHLPSRPVEGVAYPCPNGTCAHDRYGRNHQATISGQ